MIGFILLLLIIRRPKLITRSPHLRSWPTGCNLLNSIHLLCQMVIFEDHISNVYIYHSPVKWQVTSASCHLTVAVNTEPKCSHRPFTDTRDFAVCIRWGKAFTESQSEGCTYFVLQIMQGNTLGFTICK